MNGVAFYVPAKTNFWGNVLSDGVLYWDGKSITPYPGWSGNVNVAINTRFIATGAGDGGSDHTKLFDRITGIELASFFAFADDPGFRGGVNVALTATHLIVGAGKGGGPRWKSFRLELLVNRDYTPGLQELIGDSSTRKGVMVSGDASGYEGGAYPDFSYGPADGLPILLRDDRGMQNLEPVAKIMYEKYLYNCNGLIRITNVRPNRFSLEYYPTVLFNVSTLWSPGSGRATTGLFLVKPPKEGEECRSKEVIVGPGLDNLRKALVACHELGHGFGLEHSPDGQGSIMSKELTTERYFLQWQANKFVDGVVIMKRNILDFAPKAFLE